MGKRTFITYGPWLVQFSAGLIASGYELRIVGAKPEFEQITLEASGVDIPETGEDGPQLSIRTAADGARSYFISWDRGATELPFNIKAWT